MGQELLATVAIVFGLSTWLSLSIVYPESAAVACAVVVGVLASVVWWYSPLPNRTVFGGMGNPEAGYWGFSRPGERERR